VFRSLIRLPTLRIRLAECTKGKFLANNLDEPEVVIIPVAECDAPRQFMGQSEAQTEAALAGLRRGYDVRLSMLQDLSTASRLQSTIRRRAELGGKVKAGSGY
jgi:hypothetical protein